MNIKSRIDRIPGGMMIIPLFLGACLNTFAPGTGKFFGSFTNGLITGTLPILSVWFFCIGASISLKATPLVLRKSGVLVSVKIITAAIAGVIDFTEADWDLVMNINIKSVFFLCQAFGRYAIGHGRWGKIINIASMLSFQGGIRVPSYTASKARPRLHRPATGADHRASDGQAAEARHHAVRRLARRQERPGGLWLHPLAQAGRDVPRTA
jgi:hypothetical protein